MIRYKKTRLNLRTKLTTRRNIVICPSLWGQHISQNFYLSLAFSLAAFFVIDTAVGVVAFVLQFDSWVRSVHCSYFMTRLLVTFGQWCSQQFPELSYCFIKKYRFVAYYFCQHLDEHFTHYSVCLLFLCPHCWIFLSTRGIVIMEGF